MYKSFWEENKERFVSEAISEYAETGSCSAGFNILRYAEQGLISIEPGSPEDIFEKYKYGEHLKFLMLRYAKAGLLRFKK